MNKETLNTPNESWPEANPWLDVEFTMEDVKEKFTEENLAKASLEEYTALLQRYPDQLVSHVTRQGIRDHFGMMYHNGGLHEMQNGFKDIIANHGMISPAFAVLAKKKSLFSAMERLAVPNIGQASGLLLPTDSKRPRPEHNREYISETLSKIEENPLKNTSFGDALTVHFSAADDVLDEYYGAETGNEAFFTYPAAGIATQMKVQNPYYLSNSSPEKQHSDLWVLPNNPAGISVESALTFLPADAIVDEKTGSKYQTKDGQPVLDENGELVLVENGISSKEYWERYLQENATGLNLKVAYYDTSLSPEDAVLQWKKDNGIEMTKDKKEVYDHYTDKLKSYSEEDLASKMHEVVDFDEVREAYAEYFDKLEQDSKE